MRPLCVALCLIASVSWAQVEEKATSTRPLSVWFQPMMPLVVNAALLPEGFLVALPLGLSVPLGGRWKQWELMVEVTPYYLPVPAYALSVTVGSTWFSHRGPTHRGFFLQPKLVGAIGHDTRNEYHSNEGFSPVSKQLSVGLDLGYRFAAPGFYLDLLVGGSVGWGWNVPAESPSLFYSVIGGRSPRRTSKLVWDPNFHLLRIGLTF